MLCALGAISNDYSQISGLTGAREYVPQTVTLTAYDTDNNRINTGGESVNLRVEQLCTISSTDVRCALSGSNDNVPGLPIDVTMTDAGNGQYSYTFTLSGSGNVSISVTVLSPGAIYAEYWTNTAYSGTAGYTRYETTINNDWGSGTVTPTPNADYIAA